MSSSVLIEVCDNDTGTNATKELGEFHAVWSKGVLVGSDPTCDIVLLGPGIAEKHVRLSARGNDEAMAKVQSNRWFWRFNLRRLTAEELRDGILAVSGELNDEAGGPSVYPPIPKEVLAGQSRPGDGWPTSNPAQSARRSVYAHVKRSLAMPLMADHDAADTDSSCPVRYTTTVPTQSLGMLNGEFANQQAELFAARLRRETPGDSRRQIQRGILLTTARAPTADEIAADLRFLRQLEEQDGLSADAALVQYCLLLLNANAFVYVD